MSDSLERYLLVGCPSPMVGEGLRVCMFRRSLCGTLVWKRGDGGLGAREDLYLVDSSEVFGEVLRRDADVRRVWWVGSSSMSVLTYFDLSME